MADGRRPDLAYRLQSRLADAAARDRLRWRATATGPQQPARRVDGRRLVSFNSNDYLGLAAHPVIRRALRRGANRWGTGSGASHLVSGHTDAHRALEEELADWLGRERAVVFSTGYMANLGLAQTLLERGDLAVCDRLNHASLLDAALLAGARLARYRHGDARDASRCLSRRPERAAAILTDGVFSMDGDLAPLEALARTARDGGAWLVVDDAHGLGVVGPGGRGAAAHFGLGPEDVPALMGTLGKAFGCAGAFVAGSRDLIEALVNFARPYIYTTALPPALAEAARAALRLVIRESWRRDRLDGLVARFQTGVRELGLGGYNAPTPIQPLIVGSERDALDMSDALGRQGLWVPAIRPPTVPGGTARLRITLSASHTEQQVDRLLEALDHNAKRFDGTKLSHAY